MYTKVNQNTFGIQTYSVYIHVLIEKDMEAAIKLDITYYLCTKIEKMQKMLTNLRF